MGHNFTNSFEKSNVSTNGLITLVSHTIVYVSNRRSPGATGRTTVPFSTQRSRTTLDVVTFPREDGR